MNDHCKALEADMPAKLEDLLFHLEEQFWTMGIDHYRRHLADAAMMVFPDPGGVLIEDEITRSLAGRSRWTQVLLEEHRVIELNDGAVVVTYKATAQREPCEKPYVARASSAYVHDGRAWRLAFHQQTPVAAV